MGFTATDDIVARLRREAAARRRFPTPRRSIDALGDADRRRVPGRRRSTRSALVPVTILVVGVNGTGKTTTVGKLAKQGVDAGRSVMLGSADTFRAAASEQLDVWAERAGVPVVRRDRGADPAAVAFDTVVQAEETGADLTLIDTAGRLHTSADLMRELVEGQARHREPQQAAGQDAAGHGRDDRPERSAAGA